jgi:hypothetical protein
LILAQWAKEARIVDAGLSRNARLAEEETEPVETRQLIARYPGW